MNKKEYGHEGTHACDGRCLKQNDFFEEYPSLKGKGFIGEFPKMTSFTPIFPQGAITTACLDKQKVKEILDRVIEHREMENKNNNIFRLSSDELNNCFIDDIEKALKELGL